MTPRPIHHWKTLWLGLLILTSLLWAWARSQHHSDAAQILIGSTSWALGSDRGRLVFNTQSFAPGSALPDRLTFQSSTCEGDQWFQPAYVHDRYQADLSGYSFSYHGIAWWLPTLLFLLTWTSFLSYRLEMLKTKPLPATPAPPC